jgi:hypothetical protein
MFVGGGTAAAAGAAGTGAVIIGGVAATGIGAVVLGLGAGITLAVKAKWSRKETIEELAT